MTQRVSDFLDAIMGFRKFIAFILLFIVGIVFRLTGFVDGAQFTDLMKNVAVAFFATNGLEHFTTMAKDFIAAKTAPKDHDEG